MKERLAQCWVVEQQIIPVHGAARKVKHGIATLSGERANDDSHRCVKLIQLCYRVQRLVKGIEDTSSLH